MGHVQVGSHETKPIVIFVIVGRPMDLKIWIKFGLAADWMLNLQPTLFATMGSSIHYSTHIGRAKQNKIKNVVQPIFKTKTW